jgi:hypothetical protein
LSLFVQARSRFQGEIAAESGVLPPLWTALFRIKRKIGLPSALPE